MSLKSEIAIRAESVSKIYRLYNSHKDRLKEALHPRRKKYHRDFYALKDITFEVKKGEALGIIGRNGSGKSTLLQIICGILSPATGSIKTSGKIGALLELGAGFNPEFTGRENVYLNCSILGFKREEIDELFDEIVDFAEIEEFLDQPVKTYSSGMFVRLAFAIQACIRPDILIVDEALSVGDIFFQQKCHSRMEALIEGNTSILLVSHDMSSIEKYTNKVMLLDKGNCIFLGHPNEAVQRYYQINHSSSNRKSSGSIKLEANQGPADTGLIPDWPDKNAFLDMSRAVVIGDENVIRLTGVALCDDAGKPCTSFEIGSTAFFFYELEVLKNLTLPIAGIEIHNSLNIVVTSKATIHYMLKAPKSMKKGDRLRIRQTLKLSVRPDAYTFSISFASMNAQAYAHISTHQQLVENLQFTWRIRQIGVIYVSEKSEGLSVPFNGLVDLEGDCIMAVLNEKN